jgi:hypothetical protein
MPLDDYDVAHVWREKLSGLNTHLFRPDDISHYHPRR